MAAPGHEELHQDDPIGGQNLAPKPRFNSQIERKTERKRSKRFDSNLRGRGGDRRITFDLKLRLPRTNLSATSELWASSELLAGIPAIATCSRFIVVRKRHFSLSKSAPSHLSIL
ncbi:hypothetical protein ACMD2_10612 [Ananas comosus]|uniref:Uncharacterized protein n=1 Tax=Ananas comosus TaxID=4615 RepID=A0A199UTD4_ANACO|nr:hypothetical protein ACMD2_10612 [Ananas comosus]